jgi:squalene-hopene/tetraprenyl-beta-curcumene cyclase
MTSTALDWAALEARPKDLESLVETAAWDFKTQQRRDGEWLYELEPDATISSEYVLLKHFLGDLGGDYPEIEGRIARYLRGIQGADGGWPLFQDGEANISASVKAYWALKLAGDDIEAPHMQRARARIHALGGAERSNVFTRITLALFRQVPWRAVPVMPLQIMLLPEWFPFHLSKVSYWSRTVMVPLFILMHLKAKAKNPRGVDIAELFCTPPDRARYPMNATGSRLGTLFTGLDKLLRATLPLWERLGQERALKAAVDFVTERLNGEDGLGGIYPAMANAVMAFDLLGYPKDHPDMVTAKKALEGLLVHRSDGQIYCQPCLSPIWDTCLGAHALLEAGEDPKGPALQKAIDWLLEREITAVKGDWKVRRPDLIPSGWAFQYRNDYYPDVDDTAVVVMALDRAGDPRCRPAIERATNWIIGMQSSDGGWGAFEPENTHLYLNHIPFADHGALLDPPTVDVTARCLSMLAQLGYGRDHPTVSKAVDFIKRAQEPDGSWYGRWGTNYVYGTWSALSALNAAGEDMRAPYIRRAVAWLLERQDEDGGWGEDCATYWQERREEVKGPTPSQTSWALLGLMAAGEAEHDAVARGIDYLMAAPRTTARWEEELWTGVGFPRVFYLKYHGYAAYFPLWALARYQNLMRGNQRRVQHGI